MPPVNAATRHYRTVWISDVHLGFPGCRADFLLDFLDRVTCDRLYLVGDIIDFWHMRRGLYWPQAHNNVVRKLLGMAKHGTEVVYVPGNHDELLREHDGLRMGEITIQCRAIHETADGRRLLIMHGDEFDSVVQCSKLLSLAGSQAYALLLRANRLVNFVRSKFGMPYWSLAGSLKHRVKNAMQFISNFESAVARAARRHDVDGVVCGHIHRAEISIASGVLYLNCGDWVESCTALVEHNDGKIELLHWSDQQHAVKAEATLPALAA